MPHQAHHQYQVQVMKCTARLPAASGELSCACIGNEASTSPISAYASMLCRMFEFGCKAAKYISKVKQTNEAARRYVTAVCTWILSRVRLKSSSWRPPMTEVARPSSDSSIWLLCPRITSITHWNLSNTCTTQQYNPAKGQPVLRPKQGNTNGVMLLLVTEARLRLTLIQNDMDILDSPEQEQWRIQSHAVADKAEC